MRRVVFRNIFYNYFTYQVIKLNKHIFIISKILNKLITILIAVIKFMVVFLLKLLKSQKIHDVKLSKIV